MIQENEENEKKKKKKKIIQQNQQNQKKKKKNIERAAELIDDLGCIRNLLREERHVQTKTRKFCWYLYSM